MRKILANVLKGIIFVLIGLGVVGEGLGVFNFRLFKGWWTLLIIVPAIIDMIGNGVKIINSIIVAIGTVLLLSQLGVFDKINIWLLCIGVGLVIFGVDSIFGSKNPFKKKNKSDNNDTNIY